MFDNLNFITLLQKGGITVIVLAFFSILSIAVIMERLWTFFKFNKDFKIFSAQIKNVLKNGGRESAFALCESQEHIARFFKAGLLKYREGKTAVGEAMELIARQKMLYLEKYLGILGTIGNVAPFVGLFGTVIGIIRAFHDLAKNEGAGPSIVADGIAEALIATAAGILVAVPSVIAYNYFLRKINRLAVELETNSAEFIDILFEEKGSKE